MMTCPIFCKQWHRWREELKNGRKSSGKSMPRNPLHSLSEKLLNAWPVPIVFIGLILGTKKIKNRITLTHLGNSYWGIADSGAFSTHWVVARARDPQLHPLLLTCSQGVQGNKKLEIVKELRFVSHMSFQRLGQGPLTLTGGLLESETELCELSAEFVFAVPVFSILGFSSLPLGWVSLAFSFHHVTFCHVTVVGLLLCLVSASWGWAEVVSARLHPSYGTRYIIRGVCNFLDSVLLQQRFEMVDQCYSLVTAPFYLANKR